MGSYPTLFTFTRHPRTVKIVVLFSRSAPSSASKREKTARLAIIGCREVLFLWYFPYSYERSPLATATPCAARTFLLDFQAIVFRAHRYFSMKSITNQFVKCASTARFACSSAFMFCSRATCVKAHASKFCKSP